MGGHTVRAWGTGTCRRRAWAGAPGARDRRRKEEKKRKTAPSLFFHRSPSPASSTAHLHEFTAHVDSHDGPGGGGPGGQGRQDQEEGGRQGGRPHAAVLKAFFFFGRCAVPLRDADGRPGASGGQGWVGRRYRKGLGPPPCSVSSRAGPSRGASQVGQRSGAREKSTPPFSTLSPRCLPVAGGRPALHPIPLNTNKKNTRAGLHVSAALASRGAGRAEGG